LRLTDDLTVVTRLSAAVKDYLETLLSVSEGFADASEERALENNLSESDTLKMIQMMAIHREVCFFFFFFFFFFFAC
jgi:membrane protein insertase Oxa1/YidC/SpoIIIJ